MTKFREPVGYILPGQLVDGVYTPSIVERVYKGDVLEDARSLDLEGKVNSDIRVTNRISIIADAYAQENFAFIKYVLWNGQPWTVPSVTVQRPRLILTLGELYNGDRATQGA